MEGVIKQWKNYLQANPVVLNINKKCQATVKSIKKPSSLLLMVTVVKWFLVSKIKLVK